MNLFPSQYFLQYSQYYSNCVCSFVNQSNVEDKETRVKDTVIKSVRTGTAKALQLVLPRLHYLKILNFMFIISLILHLIFI